MSLYGVEQEDTNEYRLDRLEKILRNLVLVGDRCKLINELGNFMGTVYEEYIVVEIDRETGPKLKKEYSIKYEEPFVVAWGDFWNMFGISDRSKGNEE